jgi:hypothetical protein
MEENEEVIKLEGDDAKVFGEALVNPPAPSERLAEAAKSYKESIEGEAVDEDTLRFRVTQEDLIQLGMILQLGVRTGQWEITGIAPDKRCSKCYGRGHLGRNTETDQYLLCKCISKQVPAAMHFMKKVQAIQLKDKQAQETAGAVEATVPVEEKKEA